MENLTDTRTPKETAQNGDSRYKGEYSIMLLRSGSSCRAEHAAYCKLEPIDHWQRNHIIFQKAKRYGCQRQYPRITKDRVHKTKSLSCVYKIRQTVTMANFTLACSFSSLFGTLPFCQTTQMAIFLRPKNMNETLIHDTRWHSTTLFALSPRPCDSFNSPCYLDICKVKLSHLPQRFHLKPNKFYKYSMADRVCWKQ